MYPSTSPQTIPTSQSKRVLRYRKTKNLKLVHTGTPDKHGLHGFVDSDWANSQNRKSIGGYAFMLGNSGILWSSKKQTLVAQSTKAEYTVFNEATLEAL